MNWMKEQAGMEVERHPVDQFFFDLCPKLTIQQRLGGYAGCVVLGFILNIGSWARLIDLTQGNPGPFVVLFTIGNLISLFGSFILNGPYAQGKKMVGPQMRCATCAYLTAMAMTFFVAFYKGISDKNGERLGLIILLIFVQYICMIWFIICSVWFLKKMVLTCLKGTCTNACPTCAKGCKCVCDTLEDAKDNTVTAVKSTVGKKEEKKSSWFSMGNKAPEPEKKSFFGSSTKNPEPEPEPEKTSFFSFGGNKA
jgi:hypothetical protein